MIKAEKLTFGFSGSYLFRNISFCLEENCHCALIGSNGTGKTTLMNLIREPECFLFDGKLTRDGAGRIGHVSQFALREGDQSVTVFDYLCQDFLELEQRINDVCLQMESAEDMDALMERYQNLLDESDAIDADNHEVNIRLQLKLAELEDKESLALEKLSGGELKLVQIIRQMLRRPGLLIMDEPDVFLDFENLNGLRDLINAYKGTLLVVTHSRYLLAHCFDKVWHLENGDLQEFEGNFTEYSYSRLQKKIDLKIASLADEEEVQRINGLIERLRDIAEEKADPQRGRALRSKVSYLNRLMSRQVKAPFVEIRQPDICLPDVDAPEEETELLRLENYSLSFEENLLEDVSFTVHAGEKVALVGANGTGKTSMLREIWKNRHPAIHFSEAASPAFFSQLHAETLSEENMAIVRVMLEGITRSDQALGEMVEQLRSTEEPTIVVFFGDHRPNLFMTDGDTVYTKLGLCPSNDTVEWTPEQVNDLYSTDYLIWANDAALLQGQAGTEKDSSITAVGPQLLGLTGAPVSRYWGLLQKVSEVCLTNGELYFADGQGAISASEADAALTQAQRELLELRAAVLYDAFFGKNYITAAMNEAPGT